MIAEEPLFLLSLEERATFFLAFLFAIHTREWAKVGDGVMAVNR
jgi:hypothetical protein